MKRARIILADGQALVLGALQSLLEPEFEVVGSFLDGRALIKASIDLKPDVIVLDISMPLMNGLIAGQYLKKELPNTKLIYLTISSDTELTAEAFRLGASGFLLKSSDASELLRAIREVLMGRSYVTPQVTEGVINLFAQNPHQKKSDHHLTHRQKEVLQLLVEGYSMKEAATILNVSPRTVAFHKYTMMEKLQIKTSTQLIQFALKNSISGP